MNVAVVFKGIEKEKITPCLVIRGFSICKRESLLCEVWLLHSLCSILLNRRLIMRESVKEANTMRVISQPQMLDKLKEAELLLDDIQKGLNDYLEKKRLFFPR